MFTECSLGCWLSEKVLLCFSLSALGWQEAGVGGRVGRGQTAWGMGLIGSHLEHCSFPARSCEEVLSSLLCHCFCAAYFDYKDESGFPKPPSYNVATTLPSYDEAERSKAEATIPLVPARVSVLPVPALLGAVQLQLLPVMWRDF